jgi:hypothetical protein
MKTKKKSRKEHPEAVKERRACIRIVRMVRQNEIKWANHYEKANPSLHDNAVGGVAACHEILCLLLERGKRK